MPKHALDDAGAALRIARLELIARSAKRERGSEFLLTATRLRRAFACAPTFADRRQVMQCVAAVAVTLALGAVYIAVTYRFRYSIPSGAFTTGAYVVVIAPILVGLHFTNRSARRRAMATTAVSEGLCPQCRFSLEGLPANEAGLIACPECGSAWRAVRVSRPFWGPMTPDLHAQRFLASVTLGVRAANDLWILDAVGRCVQIPDARFYRIPAAYLAHLSDEERATIHGRLWSIGRGKRALIAKCAIPFAVGIIVATAMLFFVVGDSGLATAVGLLGVLGIAWMVAIPLTSAWITARKTSEVLIELGLCGSCLSRRETWESVGQDMDGCELARCPPCGATWRVEAAAISTDS